MGSCCKSLSILFCRTAWTVLLLVFSYAPPSLADGRCDPASLYGAVWSVDGCSCSADTISGTKAGTYAGKKKYGEAANLPAQLDRAAAKMKSRARKPTLDEMGPSTESKIFQPTDSRQSGPEFGPSGRSTGGAPGRRGGWKKR